MQLEQNQTLVEGEGEGLLQGGVEGEGLLRGGVEGEGLLRGGVEGEGLLQGGVEREKIQGPEEVEEGEEVGMQMQLCMCV